MFLLVSSYASTCSSSFSGKTLCPSSLLYANFPKQANILPAFLSHTSALRHLCQLCARFLPFRGICTLMQGLTDCHPILLPEGRPPKSSLGFAPRRQRASLIKLTFQSCFCPPDNAIQNPSIFASTTLRPITSILSSSRVLLFEMCGPQQLQHGVFAPLWVTVLRRGLLFACRDLRVFGGAR